MGIYENRAIFYRHFHLYVLFLYFAAGPGRSRQDMTLGIDITPSEIYGAVPFGSEAHIL